MRKWLLTTALVASLCGPASAVELAVWAQTDLSPNAALGPVATAFTDLYAKFQADNPDITLKYEILPGGTEALPSLLTAASTGNLPDVAILDSFWVARIVQTGKLQPLDGLWSKEAQASLIPAAVKSLTFDGKVYAVMFSNAWRGAFYRPSEMKTLGYDAPPSSWTEFLAYGEKAKAAGKSALMLPGAATEVTTLHLISMFWGFGGQLVDEAGKPVFFEGGNRAALEKTYGVYRELVEKGLMPESVSTMNEKDLRPFFYTGETLAIANSSSGLQQMYADKPDLNGDIGAFPLPLPNGELSAPILGGQSWGIFAEDAEHKAAAWKLVDFMNRPESVTAINSAKGYLPVADAVWQQKFFADSPLMQQFKSIFDKAKLVQTRPPVPIYPVLSAALSDQVASVLAGTKTPSQAVDAARDVVMAEFARLQAR